MEGLFLEVFICILNSEGKKTVKSSFIEEGRRSYVIIKKNPTSFVIDMYTIVKCDVFLPQHHIVKSSALFLLIKFVYNSWYRAM